MQRILMSFSLILIFESIVAVSTRVLLLVFVGPTLC